MAETNIIRLEPPDFALGPQVSFAAPACEAGRVRLTPEVLRVTAAFAPYLTPEDMDALRAVAGRLVERWHAAGRPDA